MKNEKLLNPLYIEQYGVTYANPMDYVGLRVLYDRKDTTDSLTIDYDKMLLFGDYNKSWQLQWATRTHFKPFYFKESPMVTYDFVLKLMYIGRDRYGESIERDNAVTDSIVAVAATTPNSEKNFKLEKPKRRWFDGGSGRYDYVAMSTGLWWGAMVGSDFDF
ncbi:hypothetical protein [Levilactobacillus enshiensis]|uniref:hypothetical protein n=1 Tax=Levilactobacillus enshiensis TaxID=2590213 RepID=UPI00117B7147|nr:hypothetical protein [Levilactobacillus enshiensis]